MTRTDDQLPGNVSAIHDALKARVAIAEQAKADLFVAIHVSASGSGKGFDPRHSGFEVYVSQHESSKLQQSKQFGSAVLQELSRIYTTNTTLKQRTDKGIWVLDQSPCPAMLIECGYMTNETDLTFIKQSSNQEAVAKKILEGIVSTKNKAVSAVEPAVKTEVMAKSKKIENSKPATIVRASAPVTVTTDPAFEQAPQPVIHEVRYDPTDPVTQKLTRHLCRETRYPSHALTNNGEGVVYCSIIVDASGDIKNLQLYDQAPADASLIKKVVVVGNGDLVKIPPTPLSKEGINNILQGEVKRVWGKKPDLTGVNPQSTPYYFKVVFVVDGEKTVTT
jgi:hypothetical protein